MIITPHAAYAFGEGSKDELRRIRSTSLMMMGIMGVIMTAISIILSDLTARVFVGYDNALKITAVDALIFVSLSYIPLELTNFSSAFFSGMNDGTFSLMITADCDCGLKSFLLPSALLFILPLLIGFKEIFSVRNSTYHER